MLFSYHFQNLPSLPLWPRATANLLAMSMDLQILDTACKWSHITHGLLRLLFSCTVLLESPGPHLHFIDSPGVHKGRQKEWASPEQASHKNRHLSIATALCPAPICQPCVHLPDASLRSLSTLHPHQIHAGRGWAVCQVRGGLHIYSPD